MKNIFLIGTFIFSLFVASCNKENIHDKGNVKGERITVSANISKDSQTKLSYIDDEAKKTLTFAWSEGENFMMYRGTNSNGKEFTKENGNNNFSGENPDLLGTGDYYAVHGSNISNASGVLTVDIANQVGNKDEKDGIKSFMVASSTEIGNGSNLSFEHKLTILKLELTFPAGTTGIVKEVIVGGLHNKANYSLLSNEYSYNYINKEYIIATNNTKGFTIENDKITAYISVFPEYVTVKQVAIIAVIGEGAEAVDYSYTMQNAKELSAGKLVPVSVTLTKMEDNFKSAYTQEDYYQWDAYSSCDKSGEKWEEGSSKYNPIAKGSASESCKDCPTGQQMVSYLLAGVYWDDNITIKDGQKTYILNGEEYHAGLWIKKRRYIKNFGSTIGITFTTGNDTFKRLNDIKDEEEIKKIRTSGEYFFLPACGNYEGGHLNYAGTNGYYWSSSPDTFTTIFAFGMIFNQDYAEVGASYNKSFNKRAYGYLPMRCQ